MRSDPRLKRWYNLVNKKFFEDNLPSSTIVRWSNDEDVCEDERCEEKYNGWAGQIDGNEKKYCIVISDKLRREKAMCTKLHTLVHEMCHVATELRDTHGPAFEQWRQTIADRGIFKKGAVLKRLTIF